MAKPQVDLLLAKRRTLAFLPFSLINLGLSIIMIVFSGISSYRLLKIRDDYIIEREMFHYKYNFNGNYNDNYINSNEKFCIDTIDRIRATNNFTIIFGLIENKMGLNKVIDNVSACLGFSITAVTFLVLLSVILGCFMCIYVSPSDDKIREKPSFAPNKNHCITTCFVIFKMIAFTLIDIYIIIFTLISFFSSKNFFKSIYKFQQNCVIEYDKLSFKYKFIYCWNLYNSLKKYVLFAFLFVISDIISDVFIILSKNYNVWSFILSKISGGKYEYEKVEEYKGIIIPKNEVVKDDQEIDNSNNNNNNNNNDNDYDNNIIINNNEFPDEIRGAINDSEDSFLEQN